MTENDRRICNVAIIKKKFLALCILWRQKLFLQMHSQNNSFRKYLSWSAFSNAHRVVRMWCHNDESPYNSKAWALWERWLRIVYGTPLVDILYACECRLLCGLLMFDNCASWNSHLAHAQQNNSWWFCWRATVSVRTGDSCWERSETKKSHHKDYKSRPNALVLVSMIIFIHYNGSDIWFHERPWKIYR